MIGYVLRRLLLSIVFIMLALPALAYALIGTETGVRLLLRQLSALKELGVSVGASEGTLLDRLTLKNVRYRADGIEATLDSFMLAWEPAALLSDTLHIRTLAASGLVLTIEPQPAQPESDSAWTVPKIPLAIYIDDLDLTNMAYRSGATSVPIDAVRAAAKLEQGKVLLSRLEVKTPELSARADGDVGLEATLPMQARLDWNLKLDNMPAITGKTVLQGDLDELRLDGSIGGAVELAHRATVRSLTGQPSFDLSAHWHKLKWPLEGPAQVESNEGRLTLSGTAEAYRLTLASRMAAEQLPPFALKLDAQGDTGSMDIGELELVPNQGRLVLKGRVSWADAIAFDVSAAADAVDPGAFAKDFPGSLNLRAQASGRLAGESFKGNINIARLDGRFMGYPVAAAGKLTVDKNDVQVEALTLRSDRNRLAADGRLNPDAADLRFEIDAPDLATVWPGLKGSVRGEGSIKGKYADPLLVTQLAAKGVSFQDYSVKRLDLTLDYAEALAKPSGVTVEAEDLAIAGQRIERFTLKGQGSLRKHRFDARLDAPIVNVRTVIAGGWDNQRWDGAVETLVLEHPQLSRWQLSAPWPLTVARQGQSVAVNLAEGCLQQGKAAICTQLSGSPDGRLESRTELRRIALGLFKPWLPEDLALAGHFSAQAQAVKDGGDIDAKLQLRMPEATATIARKDQTPLTVPFTETRLDADYRQKRLNADLKVGLGGTDFVQAELSAGPGATGVPIPLSGRVTASVTDFSVADALLPQIEQLTGRFDADLTLAGDTSKPVINGSGRLSGGAFKVPLAGIAVDNIGLTAAGDPNRPEHLTLTGEAHSGKGRLALTGTLDLDEAQGFPLQLRVAGENFEVAKLPQAEVELSPELNIEQAPDGIVVNGKVRVARAKIELTEIPESAITPSEDEVIVGAEPTAEAAAKPSRIRTDIEILLGDDVGFSGYGLTTKLAGKLHYTGTGRQTVMQGRVAMSDAKYKAYGQDLTLTKGEFLFNGPVDNPWLNIEATRKATGEDVTAILRVTGPLKAPQSKVSTDPALPESEALAYLLTGHSLERIGSSQSDTLAKAAFSYGAGQLSWLSDQMGIDEFDVEESERLEDSAVKLGKYITPDFYIGLSLGFFSNNYAVLLKHQLTRHFSLQTRAGETQRIDLKYQLDSD